MNWIQQNLAFNEEEHVYTYNNRVVTGVSTVLGSVGTKDKNGNWHPVGFDDRWINDDVHTNFGTAFHKIPPIILRGNTPSYPESMESHVKNLLMFFAANKIVPLEDKEGRMICEYPMLSERYRYAGTPDLVCTIKDQIYLIDWKTSSSYCHHWGYQLAAYEQLIKEVHGIKKKIHRMVVRVNEDNYHVHKFADPVDFTKFVSCLNILR